MGPYDVAADVSVENGATLTIEPGVTVFFHPGTNLTVIQGALRAVGTVAAPIVLTAISDNPPATAAPGDWGQLRFLDGTVDATTVVEHASIRFGQGIGIQSAAPTLNHLTLTDNAGPAISIDLNSSPIGVGIEATGNGLNGISVPAGTIAGNVAWNLKGIPYVVAAGTVSVGAAPTLTSISPTEISQGETLDVTVTGNRLTGAESAVFGTPGITATVLAGGTATALTLRVSAAADAVLGPTSLELQLAAGTARLDPALTVLPPKPPIVVTGLTPDTIRQGESQTFQATGEHLAGATVTTAAVGLAISNVQTTATQLTFTLTAGLSASLGSQPLSFTNPAVANGVATAQVNVLKELVKVFTSPAPIAVPPDQVQRQIRVRLSEPDTVTHSFTLAVADPTIATVSPTSVSIPAGATEAVISLQGLKTGETTLTISSSTLATVQVPLVVTNEQINTAYTPTLGVFMESDAPPNQLNVTGQTPLLGVVVESDTPPNQLNLAAHTTLLGVTLEADPAQNASSFTPLLGVIVESDSPPNLLNTASHTPLLGVILEADSGQAGAVYSSMGVAVGEVAFGIDPSVVVGGSSITLTVQGSDLDQVTGISFNPSSGITVGSPLQVSVDGKSVSIPITVGPVSADTAHEVILTTPAGKVRFADPAASQLRVIEVAPGPLVFFVSPAPLAVPPDGVARQAKLRMSVADTVDHSFTLSVANAAIATVTPATIVIPAGQIEALLNVTGLQQGRTTLQLTSSELGVVEVEIIVTSQLNQATAIFTRSIGVVVNRPAQINSVSTKAVGVVLDNPQTIGQISTTAVVGVVKGDVTQPSEPHAFGPVPSQVVGVVVDKPATIGQIPAPVVGVEK